MTNTADTIARQLADLGFAASVTLAYSWAFHASDDEGAGTRAMLGEAEQAAWDGDHPREINGQMDLLHGYVIDAYAFDPKTIDDVAFLGIRPDGTDVELTLADVVQKAARYWHNNAVAAERMGRYADADVMRLRAKAARSAVA